MTPADILHFWFEETPAELRFQKSADFDATIRARFGKLHEKLAAHIPDDWLATREGLLAAIIVLDQFSRNLYRDSPKAFAQDQDALHLAHLAIERGWDGDYTAVQRQFLYMPFMHGENMDAQNRSVELFTSLGEQEAADYAVQHGDVIERFGRFPGRNDALGRKTTPEEQAYLDKHGGF